MTLSRSHTRQMPRNRVLCRLKAGEMNKTESAYAEHLKASQIAFTSKHERDDFVADNQSDRAEAFTRAGLRGLRLGTSVTNFNMDVKCAELDADNRG